MYEASSWLGTELTPVLCFTDSLSSVVIGDVIDTTDDSNVDFLTVPQIAAVLQVSRQRCYQLVAEGVIPSVRFTERRIRIPRRSWDAYMEAREREAVDNLSRGER